MSGTLPPLVADTPLAAAMTAPRDSPRAERDAHRIWCQGVGHRTKAVAAARTFGAGEAEEEEGEEEEEEEEGGGGGGGGGEREGKTILAPSLQSTRSAPDTHSAAAGLSAAQEFLAVVEDRAAAMDTTLGPPVGIDPRRRLEGEE